jgi:hypothetical protein
MAQPGCLSARLRAMAAPTNPVPPDTMTFFEFKILPSGIIEFGVSRAPKGAG